MFDVKLGKLIVKEVEDNILNYSDFYHSDENFSKIGRKLINNPDLFIDVMNRLNVNLSIEEKCKVENANLYDLAELIMNNEATSKSRLKYLGKEAWNNVLYGYDEYENISKNINNASDEFFINLGRLLDDKEDVLFELEDYEKGYIEFISDDNIVDMKESLNTIISKYLDNCFFSNSDCQWIYKDSITDKELGRLAWDYVYKDTDEYKTLLPNDVYYIKKNTELIWYNINDDKKDLVKDYLLNYPKYSEDDDTQTTVWNEIQDSVDKIVVNNLKYYYLYEGKWDKLSNLGSMIWHMAMKYDSVFADVCEQIELKEEFISCMEDIARNISDDYSVQNAVNKSNLYNSLSNMLDLVHGNSYLEWSEYDYNNNSSWTNKQYEAMLTATNKMFNKHLSHLVKWDEYECIWTLLDSEREYYLELTKKALEGEIKYDVCYTETGEHETIDIVFEDVKNFKDYTPDIIMFFDYIDDISYKSTGVISDIVSMNEEGYGCGLDIAYNGVSCSKETEIIMNNLLELIERKGYSYKMKEDKLNNDSKNNKSLNKKPNVYSDYNKSSINVNFDSELEVLNMVDNVDRKIFTLSCMLLSLNRKNELKLLTEIKVMYIEEYDKYIIEEEFIGIDREELIKTISGLCDTHMKNQEFMENF